MSVVLIEFEFDIYRQIAPQFLMEYICYNLTNLRIHFLKVLKESNYLFVIVIIQSWSWYAPEAGAGGDEVKHLRWVEQLLEPAEELDALVVPGLGVDKDEQWRAVLRSDRLPRLIAPCRVEIDQSISSIFNGFKFHIKLNTSRASDIYIHQRRCSITSV
jgi:hypothetical protein